MKIYHVDAFTDRMFSGNPAAVCILPMPMDDVWMQNVVGEMNLSETAKPCNRFCALLFRALLEEEAEQE